MIDYEPLWATLKIQGKKKTDLLNLMSSRTLAKMSKNENISTDVLARICRFLKCELQDVARYNEIEN